VAVTFMGRQTNLHVACHRPPLAVGVRPKSVQGSNQFATAAPTRMGASRIWRTYDGRICFRDAEVINMLFERRAYTLRTGSEEAFWTLQRTWNTPKSFRPLLERNIGYFSVVAGPAERIIHLYRWDNYEDGKRRLAAITTPERAEYYVTARKLLLRQETALLDRAPIAELNPIWAENLLASGKAGIQDTGDADELAVSESVLDFVPGGLDTFWDGYRKLDAKTMDIVRNGLIGVFLVSTGLLHRVFHYRWHRNWQAAMDQRGALAASRDWTHSLAGYLPTNDDKINPNSLIGSFVAGPDFFRILVEWNVTYNNAITSCGTSDSPSNADGNGIIMDTFGSFNGKGNSEQYVHRTLVAFNISYNNGSVGLHSLGSEFVTFASNSCYNNNLDPFNNGTFRGCIDANTSYDNTYISNIAVSVTAAHLNCSSRAPYAKFNTPGLSSPPSGGTPPFTTGINNWTNNVTLTRGQGNCYGVDVPVFNSDRPYLSMANREATDPKWIDVGNSSVGDESIPAVGANFALQPGSPAIGYGKQETYLPAQSIDAGAYYHTFATCP
jgi:hypothetical protein